MDFITVHVKNLQKTIDFYQRVLGFKTIRSFSPKPGIQIIFMEDDRQHLLEFIQSEHDPVFSGQGISLGFYVNDIKAAEKHLQENEVQIIYGPVTTDDGTKLLHAQDINGLKLGFVEEA